MTQWIGIEKKHQVLKEFRYNKVSAVKSERILLTLLNQQNSTTSAFNILNT